MASKRWADISEAETFFDGDEVGIAVLHRLAHLIEDLGGAELRVARTQVGWARRRGFAYLWCPERVLGARGAALALTVYLIAVDENPRWKEVAQVRPGLWAHHLEVLDPADVDDQIAAWISRAYAAAAPV